MAGLDFPKIGNLAPKFTLLNQAGEKVSLKDYKGEKNVILYFYIFLPPNGGEPWLLTWGTKISNGSKPTLYR